MLDIIAACIREYLSGFNLFAMVYWLLLLLLHSVMALTVAIIESSRARTRAYEIKLRVINVIIDAPKHLS